MCRVEASEWPITVLHRPAYDLRRVLAKHSKNFSLVDAVSIGVNRMQRNLEQLARHIALARQTQLTDDAVKLIIYQESLEGELEVPQHLAETVHECYFRPAHDESQPRKVWSISNAFTSALKELDAVPQFHCPEKPVNSGQHRVPAIPSHPALVPPWRISVVGGGMA